MSYKKTMEQLFNGFPRKNQAKISPEAEDQGAIFSSVLLREPVKQLFHSFYIRHCYSTYFDIDTKQTLKRYGQLIRDYNLTIIRPYFLEL